LIVPHAALWSIAEQQLRGVGDAALGEWRETGYIAVHLRRRLTAREMSASAIDGVRDIRGTPEHAIRVGRMRLYLPKAFQDLPIEELV
jgi:hypothetical protein